MTVRDVIHDLTVCECVINELTEMRDKAWSEHSDTIGDAISIIEKYMDEMKDKCIK